jgi:dipeptidyl aminopeptidase/acylaminoacyl peptidase
MKWTFSLYLLMAGATLAAQGKPDSLSVEKIMRDPKWIGSSPSDPCWSFDSRLVFFKWNPEMGAADSAYAFHPGEKGPVKVSYPEDLQARAIHAGTYNKNYSALAYILQGDVYLLDILRKKTIRITRTAEEESDPGFSSRGDWVTFKSGSNLFGWDQHDGSFIQLTSFQKGDPPAAKKMNQQEEWLAREQLLTSSVLDQRKTRKDQEKTYLQRVKDRDSLRTIYTGTRNVRNLQIDPVGRYITYCLVDKPADEKNTLVPNYVTESGFTTDIPGRANVGVPHEKSSLFLYDRIRDSILHISTDSLPGIAEVPDYEKDYPQKFKTKNISARDTYVAGTYWNESGTICLMDILSLDNKDRWLMLLDPGSGHLRLADHQRDEAWIGGPGISWSSAAVEGWIDNTNLFFQSEETGYSHLYRFDCLTGRKMAVTKGNHEVHNARLSRDKKNFYFIANEKHPGKWLFYRIQTDGNKKELITSMDGGYEVTLSPDEKFIAYRYSLQNRPWELYVQENIAGHKPVQVTDKAMSAEWHAYPWRDPQIFTIQARDGKQIYARIYEPSPGKKNAAGVIFVHGAGYLQNVTYSWSYYFHEFMFNNLLADQGYTVLDIDYRASAGYGRDWRTAIYRHMGGRDLDDEVDAARWLVAQRGVDSKKIGIYGGSYGGFMTLMALFTQPGVFRSGAALRPVTDWAHYNHDYTSSILNEPFTDSLAYQISSPIHFAAGLRDHLLICHGMIDTNVHFQDAVRLAQRLIELGKGQWELAVYPLENHGFVEASSWTDEYGRILRLFDSTLR